MTKESVKKPAAPKKATSKKVVKSATVNVNESSALTKTEELRPQIYAGVTIDTVKAEFNLELIKSGYQKIADELASLEYNEDNVVKIKEALGKVKGVLDRIDEVHEIKKRPFLTVTQFYDTAKKEIKNPINELLEPAKKKYQELCQKIEKAKADKKLDDERKEKIKKLIQDNVVALAQKISDATTKDELEALEKFIVSVNDKSATYQEFHQDAIKAYAGLSESIAEKKKKVAQLAQVDKKINNGKVDEQAALQLEEKRSGLSASIEESGINVQEKAVNSLMSLGAGQAVSSELPEVKPKRTSWRWELLPEKTLADVYRFNPEFVKLEPNLTQINKRMSEIRDSKSGEERIEGSIRFFLHKEY